MYVPAVVIVLVVRLTVVLVICCGVLVTSGSAGYCHRATAGRTARIWRGWTQGRTVVTLIWGERRRGQAPIVSPLRRLFSLDVFVATIRIHGECGDLQEKLGSLSTIKQTNCNDNNNNKSIRQNWSGFFLSKALVQKADCLCFHYSFYIDMTWSHL